MAKESLYTPQKAPIFRETFADEQTTRLLGGVPTSVTYSGGVGTFNGSSSYILYSSKAFGLTPVFTVRIRLTSYTLASGSVTNFCDFRNSDGTGSGYIVDNTGGSLGVNSGTSYINGVASSTLTTSTKEIVVTGMTLGGVTSLTRQIYIGSRYSVSNFMNGSIELFEIYEGTLTANEVANLYVNKRYEGMQYSSGVTEILNVDAKNGVIANKWNSTITNTAVTPVRSGNIWAMNFNGTSSKLDCGNYNTLVGDKTFIVWYFYKPYSVIPAPRFIDNGKLYIYTSYSDPRYWYVTSNGSTTVASGIITSPVATWKQLVITRTSTGITNFYVNGASSGTANQSSGTPVAGTLNINIGAYVPSYSDQLFNGQMSAVRIADGILTAQEVSALFSSERKNYNV